MYRFARYTGGRFNLINKFAQTVIAKRMNLGPGVGFKVSKP